jgi:single-stranded-DNA-specific exonuclease
VINENLEELSARLAALADEQLGGVGLHPALEIDAEVTINDMTPELIREIEGLEPTGMKNPSPLFCARGVEVRSARTVGRDGSHLKLNVTDGRITFDAIAFRLGFWNDHLPERIDIVYAFEVNEFNGRTSLQLNIKDIKKTQ